MKMPQDEVETFYYNVGDGGKHPIKRYSSPIVYETFDDLLLRSRQNSDFLLKYCTFIVK